MPASANEKKAIRLGKTVQALESEYDELLARYGRDKSNDQLRKEVREAGRALRAKRQQGREAEVNAGMRTFGLGVRVQNNVEDNS